MKIGCYIGAWTYNIGNAFCNLGMEYVCRKAFPEATLYPIGDAVRYLFNHNVTGRRLAANCFEIGEVADIDLLVYAGMSICDEFIADNGPTFLNAAKRGIAFLGLAIGASRYTSEEAVNYIGFAKRLGRYAMIARDDDTFSMFDGKLDHLYCGIDNAFSLSHAYLPPKLSLGKYDVVNFDAEDAPHELPETCGKTVHTHHKFSGDLPQDFFSKQETLISDMPWDYLSLYANCRTTYSDRVHACVASLSYGNKAMLFNSTPRKSLFARFGLEEITERPCSIESETLDHEIERQIELVRKAVNDIL